MNEMFADHPGQTKEEDDAPPAGHRRGKRKLVVKSKSAAKQANFKTVCSYFRDQLNNLINMLMTTEPNFIRCIVPNGIKKAGYVDPFLVMHQLTCNGVLEGIRICRKGFPNRIVYADFRLRYCILAPREAYKAMKNVKRPVTDEKKNIAASHAVMDKINLIGDKFQYGHTKVFFRAGVLGHMEELRDERVTHLVSALQSWVRGYFARKVYKKLWDHKRGLLCVQKCMRGYMVGKQWLWWQLWLRIKPSLKSGNLDGFRNELAARIKYAQDNLENVKKQRAVAEKKNGELNVEIDEIRTTLAGGTNAKQDLINKITRVEEAKSGLTKEVTVLDNKIAGQEELIESLRQSMKKVDSTQDALNKDMKDVETKLAQVQDDKADKDNQVKQMREELAHQEDLIAKLQREKKSVGENKLKDEETIQSLEDKSNHLNKLKLRLEKQLDEIEDSWEREKKHKGDIEKLKRQVEGNLKLTQETVSDLERNKVELGQVVQRKEKELCSLTSKIEDEQTLGNKLNQQIKELMSRLEELDEELEAERLGRARADKVRGNLRRDLDELNERLEEAGSNTAAQIALNTRREEELAKLKSELDGSNISHESTLATLRQKHNTTIADMGDQIDQLNKHKAK
jgi:myosin heavy chain 6/7